MATIDELFKLMVEQGASDLHITSGAPPFLRIHGNMVPLNYRELSSQDVQGLIFEILSEKQKRVFVEKWELDCAYTLQGVGRFRCNVFMQRKGLGGVFRIIPEKILTAQELGLSPAIMDMIDCDKGLILVTGPTGSGKSTTLAALMHHINMTRECHVITVEDPIEFVHPNIKCLINQREVGSHTKSFANALKAALREDPDILLVGELRDLETISLALTAAETGHVVFGTLHTNSAAKTIDRIIDVFPAGQQAQIRTMLAESLRGVIAQTLFARADGQGRIAAYEIMRNTKAVSNLIREGKIHQIPSAIQTAGQNSGMVLFEKYIDDLVRKGKISIHDARSFLGKETETIAAKTSVGSVGGGGNGSKTG
ncbi:MAG: type IV pilus twitching motility protein PilT [Bdellovibrionaceae bacterium]|nr:type IV pilus twitching motility protein PilT [Pseudobdellovibrionaceae bacterium]MBX3033602.1 type IV pilus twitching motility protein PilT [Pseudobdellovibrionaceae bacterium]